MNNLKVGTKVFISGDSKDLWIKDYNARVSTIGTIAEEPKLNDKKVLVTLNEIDGDWNVCCRVRKSKIIELFVCCSCCNKLINYNDGNRFNNSDNVICDDCFNKYAVYQ